MLSDIIKERKSIRKYSDKNIPDSDLKKILTAGYLAPSWMNSQPWKFILIKDNENKKLLSELAGNQIHVKEANALIVCIADKNAWSREEFGKVLEKRGMKNEGIEKILQIPMFYPPLLGDKTVLMRSLEQVTFAVSYMMLQAKELGVDSCVIGAIANEATVRNKEIEDKVNKKLNLKDGQVIITMLTLGYAKEEGREKTRKDIDEIIHLEKIGGKINF